MNAYQDYGSNCYFHPKEVVIGICALCLKERLLILASKQSEDQPLNKEKERSFRISRRKINSITIFRKVSAFGSFLHRLDSRRHDQPVDFSDEASIGSLEDSFISIKFEDNGKASWDNKKPINAKPTSYPLSIEKDKKELKSVVEHTKHSSMLRWRKQIGRLLQLSRWKRSTKAATCHSGFNGKIDGVERRRGWMRSLTKRRATSMD
ncbi:hypothetical protein LUZ60_016004 [Juncus effusus]|nr:hypothetical protein LUZ60_016004 [Juncus effusus]